MVNYQQAIKRPFSDLKKLGIGFLLLVVPFVNIVTGFIVRGYQLECAKTALKKNFKLPEWKNLWLLFVRGILITVIGILYFIPAFLVALITMAAVISDRLTELVSLDAASASQFISSLLVDASGFIAGLIITSIVIVLTIYVLPIALMHYVEKWKFSASFKIKSVFKKSFTSKYLMVFIFIIAYSVIASLIALIFALVPVIGPLIGVALLSFILGVTTFSVLGEVYGQIK